MAVGTDRRIPLNRDRVLQVAMQLADDEGIDSLSMRKLGGALGVEAMSLYNHVARKDDLLDGMVDRVYAEIELPSADAEWEASIRTFAISAHDALVRHPWACNLIMTRPRAHPERMTYMESLLSRLRQAGFPPEATYSAYHVIDSHILGFTLWAQGHATDKEELGHLAAKFLREFPFDEYPHVAEHARQHFTDGRHKDVGAFEFGLELILDGLKRVREAALAEDSPPVDML